VALDEPPTAEPQLYRRWWPRRLPSAYRSAYDERVPLPATAYRVPAALPTYQRYWLQPYWFVVSPIVLAGFNVAMAFDERRVGRQGPYVQRLIYAGIELGSVLAFILLAMWRRRRSRDGRPRFGLVLYDDGLVDFSPMRKTVIPRDAIEQLNFFEQAGSAFVRVRARSEKPRNRHCDFGPYYANSADLEQRVVRWYDAHAAGMPDPAVPS
jgi:hypothetical protein